MHVRESVVKISKFSIRKESRQSVKLKEKLYVCCIADVTSAITAKLFRGFIDRDRHDHEELATPIVLHKTRVAVSLQTKQSSQSTNWHCVSYLRTADL